MVDEQKGWVRRRVETALRRGFLEAYETVKVNPEHYLLQLRVAYGLPVTTYQGMLSVPLHHLDAIANDVIRSAIRIAVAEGAGLGLGGFATLLPDLGILSVITMRTIQKLSLLYGFEFNTEAEVAELWVAAASAAGVDISRELLEKGVLSHFVPRVIQKMAVQASKEMVEKWAGRLVPVVSSVVGGGLNYYFVRGWGERALRHFREKNQAMRQRIAAQAGEASAQLLDAPASLQLPQEP
jgi:DNA-binding Lrp family transcriptional regulator